jgi:long-chain acyl-CoA synthetase
VTAPSCLAALLEQRAHERPGAAAIRHKRLGIWHELSWSEYATAVLEVALGLDSSGVRAGDRVAIFADNSPSWLFTDLAAQAIGAWSTGIYAGIDLDHLVACLERAEPTTIVCGDQEQVDALNAVADRLGRKADRLVVLDAKGLHTPEYAGLPLETFDDLRARGRDHPGGRERLAELVAARRPDEVVSVGFSSGTTGPPVGALHTHGSQLAMARLVAERLGFRARDRSFSLLPLAHVAARVHDGYAPLVAGSSVHFAEAYDTVQSDLVEIAPTMLLGTPRLLERVKGDVDTRIERAGRVKRGAYRVAVRMMTRSTNARLAGRRGPGVGAALARALVGRFVVAQAGLGALRYGGVSGSFVAPDLIAWFWALGVPMREQYGQVETGGIVTTQRSLADADTAGPPLDPEIEVRVDDGELLVRSPGLLAGLLGEPAPLEDGWFRTGDLGRVDDEGRIVPVGRRASVLVSATGEEISPAEIESSLKASPYVASAMAVAADRPFVTAVVELHRESVAEWARRRGIPVTTYASLVESEAVARLIDEAVAIANRDLPEASRVRAVRILPRPLDRELTPTGKIRRTVVEAEHAELIETMYAGAAVGSAPGALERR